MRYRGATLTRLHARHLGGIAATLDISGRQARHTLHWRISRRILSFISSHRASPHFAELKARLDATLLPAPCYFEVLNAKPRRRRDAVSSTIEAR